MKLNSFIMDDREKDRQGKKVLFVIAVTMLVYMVGVLQDCNATCMEQWINHHRMEPLDFVLWKTKLCELVKGPSCTSSMRITLADHNDAVIDSNIDPIELVRNLTSFQNKYQENMQQDHEDRQHEDISKTCNIAFNSTFLAQDRADLDFSTRSKYNYILCNTTGENEDNVIVLDRRSTIFRINDIFSDYSIKKKRNFIHITIRARQDSDCTILLNEALIFMTIVNFKPDTYELTNKKYHPNISIIQYFNLNKIYVTNDGQSFIWYWIWGINILFISLLVRIWYFTGKMFAGKSFYRFTCSTFSTNVCDPSVISTHTPFTDILKTYIRDRAWFRKILLICSSYGTTFLMIKIVSCMTGVIDSNHVVFISVLFNVLLLILFMTECFAKYNNQHMTCLPEPCEAFEVYILISPMLLCLIHFSVKISSVLYKQLSSYDKMVRLFSYLSKNKGNKLSIFASTIFFIPFIAIVCGCATSINKNLLALLFEVFLIALLRIDFCNIMYWIFRCIVFIFHCGIVQYIVYACMQVISNLYHQHAEWMFLHKEWIAIIFLCMSYLRDVSNEYHTVLKQCLQSVVSLITVNKSMDCINSGKVAILAVNENESNTAYTMRNEQGTMNSNALLFYHHGVPHVTSKFYYELRKLLDQILGSSFSMKRILIIEIESLCFRMLPIIITILVINTSNLSMDKFEGVQKYLVTFILFELYSKFLFKRKSPKIEIDSNPYFKTKLQELISQHKEVFHITNISKQKENFPTMPNLMMIVTFMTVVLILVLSQVEKYPSNINSTIIQLCDHLNFSSISHLLQGLIVLIHYLFFILLLMNS
ncbi:uncharacterized protein LOC134694638 [Mytilus trossulus]|uniref:uncharacterized protein LOC134694638 n=1 Tax=Mytilus trossulus TaxID=6551 RepID=UPI00300411E7